ncbi:MAG: hypothetical protein E7062_06435 [Spirochaetaceae bacterium]|nr:hypothetical protein [Spirochaetaceae bacterium]
MLNKQILLTKSTPYLLFFWIFVLSCFLGTLLETLFHLIVYKEFQNRAGLIYGPFNPVYGFGALIMTIFLRKIQHRSIFLIFVCSTFIGLSFEYICSLFQEIVLNSLSWSYSDTYFSIHGRTNVIFGFFWGILGCIWIKILYPFFYHQLGKIHNPLFKIVSFFFALFMIFNMAISFLAVFRQSKRIQNIPAKTPLDFYLDLHYPDARLAKTYPEMIFLEEE